MRVSYDIRPLQLNSHVRFKIVKLQTAAGVVINTATVTVRLQDRLGADLTDGPAWPVDLPYVGGSSGNYEASVDTRGLKGGGVLVKEGDRAKIEIVIDDALGHSEYRDDGHWIAKSPLK